MQCHAVEAGLAGIIRALQPSLVVLAGQRRQQGATLTLRTLAAKPGCAGWAEAAAGRSVHAGGDGLVPTARGGHVPPVPGALGRPGLHRRAGGGAPLCDEPPVLCAPGPTRPQCPGYLALLGLGGRQYAVKCIVLQTFQCLLIISPFMLRTWASGRTAVASAWRVSLACQAIWSSAGECARSA